MRHNGIQMNGKYFGQDLKISIAHEDRAVLKIFIGLRDQYNESFPHRGRKSFLFQNTLIKGEYELNSSR